ncbi:hypothetical protein [Haloactinopolyspora sp.]|uniref:hypothetical protein n=1 Tax=Haloactinopolyspora sp. TaxID=1966353 RepID=UPI002614BBF7|nr:hypothetical protein [Haloactinopolyspora sp.]
MTSGIDRRQRYARRASGLLAAAMLPALFTTAFQPDAATATATAAVERLPAAEKPVDRPAAAQPGPDDFGYLTATDDLGRTLAHYGEVPEPRADRYVGLFYFLWLGQHSTSGPYNITEILEDHPEAVHDPDHPVWGPVGSFHHWGEPLFDYYFSDDAWVLRRHAQMLAAAQVDFLFFDVTNAFTYKPVYDRLLEVFDDVRRQGWDVPQIAFYTNSSSGATIEQLYADLYQPGRYRELWFEFDGKPLIIGDPDEVSDEIRDFFTFRLNQWPNEPMKEKGFPWISFERPQQVFEVDGEPEIVNVAVAVHNNFPFSDQPFYGHGTNWSRSFHDGAMDPAPDAYKWGYNFTEQWEHAIDVDPRIVAVTGWNEWVAQRFTGDFPGWDGEEDRPDDRPVFFVDQATTEFSRDAEPMKGGYNDNYYLQLVDYIRQYKGLGAQAPPSEPRSIDIDGDFAQWADVEPVYRDFVRDTQPRAHAGFGGAVYSNGSGRNDFAEMKVARDDRYLYFYARTAEPIVRADRNWMSLYLNVDGDGENGWKGHDFVVNRAVVDDSRATLEASRGGWAWRRLGDVKYRTAGNEFHVAVPRAKLGLHAGERLHVEFTWADNVPDDGDVMDFYVDGDTAPDGRFTYLFTEDDDLHPSAP